MGRFLADLYKKHIQGEEKTSGQNNFSVSHKWFILAVKA